MKRNQPLNFESEVYFQELSGVCMDCIHHSHLYYPTSPILYI